MLVFSYQFGKDNGHMILQTYFRSYTRENLKTAAPSGVSPSRRGARGQEGPSLGSQVGWKEVDFFFFFGSYLKKRHNYVDFYFCAKQWAIYLWPMK